MGKKEKRGLSGELDAAIEAMKRVPYDFCRVEGKSGHLAENGRGEGPAEAVAQAALWVGGACTNL
jgi:hypothetical protein